MSFPTLVEAAERILAIDAKAGLPYEDTPFDDMTEWSAALFALKEAVEREKTAAAVTFPNPPLSEAILVKILTTADADSDYQWFSGDRYGVETGIDLTDDESAHLLTLLEVHAPSRGWERTG